MEETTETSLALLNQDIKIVNNGPKFGKRHIQILMLSVLMYMAWSIRNILSVSIVSMTTSVNNNTNIPTYNWTDKSLIMSSFLWGYFIPQFGAGYLADLYGGKWFLVVTTSITAITGLMIPLAASVLGSKGVMVCRLIQGLSQGFLYPCMAGLLGKWIPSGERSRLGTYVYSSGTLGIVTSMIFTGYISASPYGWPYAFYLSSTMCLVVVGIYAYVGCNNPNEHSTITKEEKIFIQNNLKTKKNRQELKTPFKEIFTSIPFYALIVTNIAFNYTHWTFITETAIYMDKVMHFNIKSNSVLSSLPYIGEILLSLVASWIADFLSSKKIFSLTIIRRIMNNIGLVIPAIALYLLGNAKPDEVNLVVILIITVSTFQGTGKSGHVVNHMDLAPNFSGVMMGITNGTAVTVSMMAPVIVHFVVTDETNQDQWRIIFYIALTMNVIAAVINTFFISGKLQPWSQGSRKNQVQEENVKAPV